MSRCLCDLTANECDAYCCCDPDCSATQQAGFDKCLTSALSIDSRIEYCPASAAVISSGVSGVKQSTAGTCLYVNNVASNSGVLLTDPGTVPDEPTMIQAVQSYTSSAGDAKYIYSLGQLVSDNVGFTAATTAYEVGTPVFTKYSGFGPGLLGVLSLPAALDDGLCNDFKAVEFMQDSKSGCTRRFANIATGCVAGGSLDANVYLQGLQFPKTPSATDLVNIAFRQFYCGSQYCCLSTGNLVSCSTAGDLSALVANPLALTLPAPTLSNGACLNSLTGMNVTIAYKESSGAMSISGVTVDLFFNTPDKTTVYQEFAVNYVPDSPAAMVYKRSGNPGYLGEMPVLAGVKISNSGKDAVSWTPNMQYGLTLPSRRPDTGVCTGNTAADLPFRVPVLFGQDTVSGCTLQYSLVNLRDDCATIRQTVLNYQMGLRDAALTHVGKFGNSSYLNINDWVEILNPTPPPALTAANTDAGTSAGVCSSLLSEFNIQFLYVPVGSVANPQNIIVGARYEFVAGQYAYRCSGLSCLDTTTSKQNFNIRSTVSFVKVKNSGFTSSSSTASLANVKVSTDIFYPFWYQKSGAFGSRLSMENLLVLLCALVALSWQIL